MLESAVLGTQLNKDDAFPTWAQAGRRATMRHDANDRTAGPMPFFSHLNGETLFGAQTKSTAGLGLSGQTPADATNDDYNFGDVLDVINPLQHLPVIGTFYRQITGDTIKGISAILGGALFGGPVGAVVSTADVIVRDRTGMDTTQNLMSLAGFSMDTPAYNKADITYASSKAPLGNNSEDQGYAPVSVRTQDAALAYTDHAKETKHNFSRGANAGVTRWNA